MDETIKSRCQNFLEDTDLPMTRFAKKVQLSTSAIYKWLNGNLRLKPETVARIDECITKYGF